MDELKERLARLEALKAKSRSEFEEAPYLRDIVDEFYIWLYHALQKVSDGLRRIYCGDLGYYVSYIILFLAALIFIQLVWCVW